MELKLVSNRHFSKPSENIPRNIVFKNYLSSTKQSVLKFHVVEYFKGKWVYLEIEQKREQAILMVSRVELGWSQYVSVFPFLCSLTTDIFLQHHIPAIEEDRNM